MDSIDDICFLLSLRIHIIFTLAATRTKEINKQRRMPLVNHVNLRVNWTSKPRCREIKRNANVNTVCTINARVCCFFAGHSMIFDHGGNVIEMIEERKKCTSRNFNFEISVLEENGRNQTTHRTFRKKTGANPPETRENCSFFPPLRGEQILKQHWIINWKIDQRGQGIC